MRRNGRWRPTWHGWSGEETPSRVHLRQSIIWFLNWNCLIIIMAKHSLMDGLTRNRFTTTRSTGWQSHTMAVQRHWLEINWWIQANRFPFFDPIAHFDSCLLAFQCMDMHSNKATWLMSPCVSSSPVQQTPKTKQKVHHQKNKSG